MFVRKDREGEITENMIKELNKLKEEDALWCIKNLREKPRQVRGTGKNQMDIQGMVTMTDTLETFTMKALIDSGCTGSCINEEFVAKHKMNLTALPKPILVYNTDGSLDVSGSLTHVVQLKMNVSGHEELIDLGVSNLGGTNSIGGILKRKLGNSQDSTEQKSNGEPLFLCKKEGWQTMTGTRLSQVKQNDDKKSIPPSPYFGTSGPTKPCEDLLQNGCKMGIQQYLDQGSR